MSGAPNFISNMGMALGANLIDAGDKIYASYTSANASAISVFISSRFGAVFNVGVTTSTTNPGNAIIASFPTTQVDGTTLYYTIE